VLLVAIVLILLSPIIAQFIYLAISRRREYLADASGAQYSRYPEGLARALEKIGGSSARLRTATQATAPMYFVNPLKVTAAGLADLSATHPPLSERVRILRSMGGMADLRAYDEAFRRVSGRAVGVVPFSRTPEKERTSARSAEPASRVPLPDILPIPGVGAAIITAQALDDPVAHAERVRETTDLLWKLQDYAVIECPCGTRLKIPPVHQKKMIACPHCDREHRAA
ncbi:MAG TPA: M48 family metalloprotease, partial [Thermoanaerobaculia bacterium]|nr:M48 family metalloprotease [Thermoanaerobaculia bacterium]